MLNDVDVKKLFDVRGKNLVDRAIVTQTKTKYCRSFIRDKLMLRYNFEVAILMVRDEIMHKIMSEKPLLIQNALSELCVVRSNIEKCNALFFSNKTLSDIIPNYMLLINYIGLTSKNSKICNRLKNYLTISQKFLEQKISKIFFENESHTQLESLERKLNFYTRSDPADVIIFILRHDIKKR